MPTIAVLFSFDIDGSPDFGDITWGAALVSMQLDDREISRAGKTFSAFQVHPLGRGSTFYADR
jgi:hypothetical protein